MRTIRSSQLIVCLLSLYIQFFFQPSPWQSLKNQIYLGSDKFVEKIQLKIDGTKELSEVPSSQRRLVVKDLSYYELNNEDRNKVIVEAYKSGGLSR